MLEACLSAPIASVNLHYQPIVRWPKREVLGHEALLRTEEHSVRNPLALLKAARVRQRPRELSHAVWAALAADVERFGIEGDLFVPVDPDDLEDDLLFCRRSPLAPIAKRVVLEVTERQALHTVVDLRARMLTLRRRGFRMAIDDLGAGYSALTSFAQLEPEVVKIDGSLVRQIQVDSLKQRLVKLVVSLCTQLRTTVIAQGVETRDELVALRELGCTCFQGHLFARPGSPVREVLWEAAGRAALTRLGPRESSAGASRM